MKSKMTRNYPLNRFSVAPMLDWTDRHCRYFHRLLTQQALLYTEMVTTGAILHGKGDYLSFSKQEQPVSLQLGGCDPNALAQCAKLAQQYGYSEINLNVGCPSDRVQNGRFGACLMADAQLVAHCVAVMRDAVSLPITVKCRIGIDDQDDYAFLVNFINKVSNVGCDSFILHARKAWLSGLSPKQNREIPPLDYERVYQIKRDFPQLMIAVNGGIKSLEEAQEHLKHVDGVMIGREAYQNPALLLGVDSLLFNQSSQYKNGIEVVEALYPYISAQLSQGVYLGHMTRHILGLFHGLPGAKQFRRYLSENAHRSGADLTVLETALSFVERGHNK